MTEPSIGNSTHAPLRSGISSENKRDVFDIAVLLKRRLLNFALVAFQDVVEIGGDREGFAFARQILRIIDSEQLSRDLGACARRRIEESLNWECEKRTLLEAYAAVLSR